MPSGATIAARSAAAGVTPVPTPPVVTAPPAAGRGPAFVIGVCQQPAESMAGWKAMGVNAALDVPQGHDPVAWAAECRRVGMWQIRAPLADPKADARDPWLLAWSHHDEPELDGVTPATCKANHDATAGLGVPWLVNFDGSRVLGIQGGLGQADYAPYLPSAEWLSQDVYPVSGWNNNIPLASPFAAYARLSLWAPGKPQLIYVGCGRQGLTNLPGGGRAETVDEFKYFVRTAKAIGARGIVLFPLQVGGGFQFDVMPAELRNCLADLAPTLSK